LLIKDLLVPKELACLGVRRDFWSIRILFNRDAA
jgi:hypothetical protein